MDMDTLDTHTQFEAGARDGYDDRLRARNHEGIYPCHDGVIETNSLTHTHAVTSHRELIKFNKTVIRRVVPCVASRQARFFLFFSFCSLLLSLPLSRLVLCFARKCGKFNAPFYYIKFSFNFVGLLSDRAHRHFFVSSQFRFDVLFWFVFFFLLLLRLVHGVWSVYYGAHTAIMIPSSTRDGKWNEEKRIRCARRHPIRPHRAATKFNDDHRLGDYVCTSHTLLAGWPADTGHLTENDQLIIICVRSVCCRRRRCSTLWTSIHYSRINYDRQRGVDANSLWLSNFWPFFRWLLLSARRWWIFTKMPNIHSGPTIECHGRDRGWYLSVNFTCAWSWQGEEREEKPKPRHIWRFTHTNLSCFRLIIHATNWIYHKTICPVAFAYGFRIFSTSRCRPIAAGAVHHKQTIIAAEVSSEAFSRPFGIN